MKHIMFISLMVITALTAILRAGPLNPTAPPTTGTMKTLDEVEPRTAINQQNTPGDASYEYIIGSPGSYYLSGNVTTTKAGIHVEADYVTIDLMGYELAGPGMAAATAGIYMNGRDGVEIRNGSVRGFYNGIIEDSDTGQNHRVFNVRAVSNLGHGIYLAGKGCMIRDCTAIDNGGSAILAVYGIYANTGSILTGNEVYNNGTSASADVYGLYGGISSIVSANTSRSNGTQATGSYVYGIGGFIACTVSGNTAGINGYDATGSYVYGIYGSNGSTIIGNTAYNVGNSAASNVYGIYAGVGCDVISNTSDSNGLSATKTTRGIYLHGNCLVNNNTAYNNNGTNIYDAAGTCLFGLNHAP